MVIFVMGEKIFGGPFFQYFYGDGKNVCGVLIWLYGAGPHSVRAST